MKVNVLGVKIDDISIPQIVGQVEKWLEGKGKYYIVTPNPEIVVMAQQDLELKRIINEADLAIPDGNGLKVATDIESNSPGVDVLERLVKLAAEKGFTVAFLGGRKRVAEKVSERLLKKYPDLIVTFAGSGGEVDEEGRLLKLPKELKSLKIDLLFVAFGPPKQEKWIAKNLDKIPVRVAMGVGGSFDYLSGEIPRAPVFIRKLGFEWLFRLIIQPWRIKRQMALLEYMWLVFR